MTTWDAFFVIGWIAKIYPELVKKIASKYEVGSHTMNHQLMWQQTPAEFRSDVELSVKLLEDLFNEFWKRLGLVEFVIC